MTTRFAGCALLIYVVGFARSAEDHPRFPVARFPVTAQNPAWKPSAVVLADSDADFQKGIPHHDELRILQVLDADGGSAVKSTISKDFNTCETIGSIHCVAIDAARGRIYVIELVANRVTALDLGGRKLWAIGEIKASALAVDPETGRIWCVVGRNLAEGETVVFDDTGREVASYRARGVDIVYDPHTDGFWLAGDQIAKLSRDGTVLFRQRCDGWAYASVSVNSNDGSVWIVERAHPDVAGSANRLWHRDAKGGVLKSWPLGDNLAFGVACQPKTGTAWVTSLGSEILRFNAHGASLPTLPIQGRAIAISPTSGRIWLTTERDVLWLDEANRPHSAARMAPRSIQSWLAAF